MAVFLDENQVGLLNLSATGIWETIDLDTVFQLPPEATGAMLLFASLSSGANLAIGAREPSDTGFNTTYELRLAAKSTLYVKCNSAHEVQINRQSTDTEVWLIGYFTTDVDWLPAQVNVTPGITGSWTDIDLSGYTSGGELFALINVYAANWQYHNMRYNGAVDDRDPAIGGSSAGTCGYIVPLDANDIVEIKYESVASNMFLQGFVNLGTKRVTGGSNLFSGLPTNSYSDFTLPDPGKEIAILEIFSTFGATDNALRPNGETNYPDLFLNNYYHNGYSVVSIDGSDLAEAKISDSSCQAYCWGYLQAPGAPPSGWTGKVGGVTNPAKVNGVLNANIAKVTGV